MKKSDKEERIARRGKEENWKKEREEETLPVPLFMDGFAFGGWVPPGKQKKWWGSKKLY